MSLLTTKKGNDPVALLNNKIVYLGENGQHNLEGKVEILPETQKRSVISIYGPSGCGKTFWINQFIKKYMLLYPNNNIYFIGPFEQDPSIDMKGIEHIETGLFGPDHEEVFPSDLFANSLVVFDDCGSVNSKTKKYIYEVVERIATTGRHYNTSLIVTSHNLLSGNQDAARIIKNESNGVVLFPKVNWYQSERYLTTYLGMTKKEANQIKNIKSRWVFIKRSYPLVLIAENEIKIL